MKPSRTSDHLFKSRDIKDYFKPLAASQRKRRENVSGRGSEGGSRTRRKAEDDDDDDDNDVPPRESLRQRSSGTNTNNNSNPRANDIPAVLAKADARASKTSSMDHGLPASSSGSSQIITVIPSGSSGLGLGRSSGSGNRGINTIDALAGAAPAAAAALSPPGERGVGQAAGANRTPSFERDATIRDSDDGDSGEEDVDMDGTDAVDQAGDDADTDASDSSLDELEDLLGPSPSSRRDHAGLEPELEPEPGPDSEHHARDHRVDSNSSSLSPPPSSSSDMDLEFSHPHAAAATSQNNNNGRRVDPEKKTSSLSPSSSSSSLSSLSSLARPSQQGQQRRSARLTNKSLTQNKGLSQLPPPSSASSSLSSLTKRAGGSTTTMTKTPGVNIMAQKPRMYKFSLDALIARAGRDEASEEAYRQARSLADQAAERARGPLDSGGNGGSSSDANAATMTSSDGLTTTTTTTDVHMTGTGHAGVTAAATAAKASLDPSAVLCMLDKQDADDRDRLLLAIKRTEALQYSTAWDFFGPASAAVEKSTPPPPPFPSSGFGFLEAGDILSHPPKREAGLLSGYLAELAADGALPAAVSDWILRYSSAAASELREDLGSAYLLILERAKGRSTPSVGVVSRDWVSSLFAGLGASEDARRATGPVRPELRDLKQARYEQRDWKRVEYVLAMISLAAKWMDQQTRFYSMCILLRLGMDASLRTSGAAILALQRAITSVVKAHPRSHIEPLILQLCEATTSTKVTTTTSSAKLSPTGKRTTAMVSDAQLRLQLLDAIPSSCPRTCRLRRSLALAFFDENAPRASSSSSSSPPSSPPDLGRLAAALKRHPDFAISPRTDYNALRASAAILDIAIDDGGQQELMRPHDHHHHHHHHRPRPASGHNRADEEDGSANTQTNNNNNTSNAKYNDNHDDKEREDKFDARVDALAAAAKDLATRIHDTGASHLARTAAKEALEALYSRLEFGVRTRPRPKKSIFGDAPGRKEAGFMSEFFKKDHGGGGAFGRK